jgi:hypothetical protein
MAVYSSQRLECRECSTLIVKRDGDPLKYGRLSASATAREERRASPDGQQLKRDRFGYDRWLAQFVNSRKEHRLNERDTVNYMGKQKKRSVTEANP